MRKMWFVILLSSVLLAAPARAEMITTVSGLRYDDLIVGTGPEARPGSMVDVDYTGWLNKNEEKGRKFDSSLDRHQSFSFKLGTGKVIKGWDEGLVGMKAGGKRILYIPAHLGYGGRGAGGGAIPPNASLIFEVELLLVDGQAGKAAETAWGNF